MSHQVAAIAVPEDQTDDWPWYVEGVMAEHSDYEITGRHLYFDWYVIGGRWAGAFFTDGSDVGTVEMIDRSRKVYTYVGLDRVPHSQETFEGGEFIDTPGFENSYAEFLDSLPPKTFIVIVDYHN